MWQDYLTLGRALTWLDVFAVAFFAAAWLMIVASAWVVYVLYAREFRSRTLKALVEEDRSFSLTT